ncbi:MAG: hypothetical protein ACOX22_04545 [Caldicoprobacterales bacterium]
MNSDGKVVAESEDGSEWKDVNSVVDHVVLDTKTELGNGAEITVAVTAV